MWADRRARGTASESRIGSATECRHSKTLSAIGGVIQRLVYRLYNGRHRAQLRYLANSPGR